MKSPVRKTLFGCCVVGLLLSGVTRAGDPPVSAPVADAAEQQQVAEVVRLIAAGADVNAAQVDGMTALHWAAYHDNADLVSPLLEANADVNAQTRYGVAPLSLACLNGNAAIVERLLNAGAGPDTSLPGGETALMTAARTGIIAPVALLLAHGADVNAREHNKQTAVMWAAAEGHVDVVDALIEAGADLTTPLSSGFTPLFFAVREGRTETALHLIRAGLDINAPMERRNGKPGPNPLLLAVENGHFETAAALLAEGADPNAQPEGHAALHAISWVRKPIRGDGDPSPVGSGNLSPLEFVRVLAAHHADVNLQLADGRSGFADFTTTGATPFVLAAQTGDLPLLRLLLELGADPFLTNADDSTALLAAAGIGDLGSGQEAAGTEEEAIATVELLLELGADINAIDSNGETALHGAAYQNWPRLVQFLADHGIDPEYCVLHNRWGWTPLLIAQGYREGNFRPDPATIAAIERVMQDAGVPIPPPPGPDFKANQQSWDKQKPKAPPKRAPVRREDRKPPEKEPPADSPTLQ